MLEQFYTITDIGQDGEGAVAWLELNPAHAVYEGHFPGMPVVPGVCTLMMVKGCAGRISGKKLSYRHISTCKFLTAILPSVNNCLKLAFTLKETVDGEYAIQARMYAGDGAVLKLKANFTVI